MTRRPRATRTRADWRERGSVTLEGVVVAPMLLVLFGVAVAGGRIAISGGAVEEAARDAARQASLARNAAAARTDAATAARATLTRQHLQCASMTVHTDTSGFAVPVGQPASVTATVTCVVRLSDTAVPGLPGHRALTARFTSPLDRYRER